MINIKSRLIQIILPVLLCVLFFSCKKSEDQAQVQMNNPVVLTGIYHFRIDSVEQKIDSLKSNLDTMYNFSNGYHERSLQTYIYSGNKSICLTINNWSFEFPPTDGITIKQFNTCFQNPSCNTCIWTNTDHLCDQCVMSLIYPPNYFNITNSYTGYTIVSSNNNFAHLVSFTFNGKLYGGNSESHLVDGSVEDMKYTIHN